MDQNHALSEKLANMLLGFLPDFLLRLTMTTIVLADSSVALAISRYRKILRIRSFWTCSILHAMTMRLKMAQCVRT
jgi:hypothetical protein